VALLGERQHGGPVGQEAAGQDDAARWAGLARRVGQGDRAAEAELADLFHQRVRLFASARLHGSDAASDIAQETILAVIEALRAGRLREPYNLPGFVLGTARNLVNNHHRKQARNPEVLEDPPDRPAETDGQWAGLDHERRALVRKALGRLNALDRRILLLTLIEGMHPREIAPIVGLKPDVVRTRKARAVRIVADEIERATRTRPQDYMGMSGPTPGAGR
jgi:RNA polymerase sigma-70 factor (ECF subfamily)